MPTYETDSRSSMNVQHQEREALRLLRYGWVNLIVGIVFGLGINTQAFAIQQPAKAPSHVSAPHPLSVPPLEVEERKYPDDRPEWIGQPPDLEGIVHRWPICSAPSLNDANAEQDLREQARAAVRAYIRDQFPSYAATAFDPLLMNDAWLSELMDSEKTYRGAVTTDDREWREMATQLVFGPTFREEIQRVHKQSVVGDRMRGIIALVGFAAVSLASLSTVLRMVGGRRETVPVR